MKTTTKKNHSNVTSTCVVRIGHRESVLNLSSFIAALIGLRSHRTIYLFTCAILNAVAAAEADSSLRCVRSRRFLVCVFPEIRNI